MRSICKHVFCFGAALTPQAFFWPSPVLFLLGGLVQVPLIGHDMSRQPSKKWLRIAAPMEKRVSEQWSRQVTTKGAFLPMAADRHLNLRELYSFQNSWKICEPHWRPIGGALAFAGPKSTTAGPQARILNHDVRCSRTKFTIASKTIVFKGVEPQLRHLEPVGGKSTLAHLSVHFHIFVHNFRKTITFSTFDHFWQLLITFGK